MKIASIIGRIGAAASWPALRGFAAPLLAIVLCGGAATLAVDHVAFLNYADRIVGDWQTAALLAPAPQDSDIVIVAIDDETLARFAYVSPVDRLFLSQLLTAIAARGPRAIGLDMLLKQASEPAKDETLRRTLATLPVPLVVAYADEDGLVTPAQSAELGRMVPETRRGLSLLSADQFGTVRWIYPGHVGPDGRYVPGFDRALAAAAGIETPAEPLAIAWHGRPRPGATAFAVYPAHLLAALPAAWFKDKIVLVGTVADHHRTPFAIASDRDDGMLPAVEIHAHAVAQLLHHAAPAALGPGPDFAIALLAAALGAALGVVGWPLTLRFVVGAGLLVALWSAGAALFHETGVMVGLLAPTLALPAGHFALEAMSGREARRQREFVTGAFAHYVSPKVVDALIRDPARMSLAGERRVMTYLFTDIADFTAMSEALDSKELARTLNDYFDGLSEVVLAYDGTIGKFEGDAVFVIFNAPMDQHDHAERAVRCARDIDRFAETYGAEQRALKIPFGHTRIGVHTGPAVVGNFGSRKRFDYTAQGDAVNIAARLEGVNKRFGTRICISAATTALCHGIAFRPLGSVIVKGRHAGIAVFEPLADSDAGTPYQARYREAYAKLECLSPDALGLFAALNSENPDDRCVALHLERLYRGERGAELELTEK